MKKLGNYIQELNKLKKKCRKSKASKRKLSSTCQCRYIYFKIYRLILMNSLERITNLKTSFLKCRDRFRVKVNGHLKNR